MLTLFVAMLAAEVSASAPISQPLVEPDPKTMTQREIKAFNATIPNNHPFHIRCVRTVDTGSLVRGSYSCRTNHQWALADDKGNQNARDTFESMQGKAAATSN